MNNNNLISRAQTYVLDRKLISIHSNDRDIKKYPKANSFEITLPEPIYNIQSLCIVETVFPIHYIMFSNKYQNTKMSFKVFGEYLNSNTLYTIELDEGSYTPTQLCLSLQHKMNRIVNSNTNNITYDFFKVVYDEVCNKIYFGNSRDQFSLDFGRRENYDVECDSNNNVWNQYTNWGLPYYLGYEKKTYKSVLKSEPQTLDYRDEPIWLKSSTITLHHNIFVVNDSNMVCLDGESVMYMEIDKYNSLGEIVPFSHNTSGLYNNDYNGSSNAAFEKIPINLNNKTNSQTFNSHNNNLHNLSHYETPITSISKLKFKFRFHDGRLVYFGNSNFNFTIAFNCFKDEIQRVYDLRIPATYNI